MEFSKCSSGTWPEYAGSLLFSGARGDARHVEVKGRIFVERQAVPTFRPKEIENRRIFPPLTTIFTSPVNKFMGVDLLAWKNAFHGLGWNLFYFSGGKEVD